MARPERLTPGRQERFLEAIRRGAFPEVAARYAGFSPASLYRYMKGETPEQAAFRDAVLLAVAELEVRLVGLIALDAETNPRAAQAFLERRIPSRWGRNAAPASLLDDLDDEMLRAGSAKSEQHASASPSGYTPMMVPVELLPEFTERLLVHERGIMLPPEDGSSGLRIGPDDDRPDDS